MKKKQDRIIFILGSILFIGLLCWGLTFVALGSGITLWFAWARTPALAEATPRLIHRAAVVYTSIPISATPSASPPTGTATLTPTQPPTATPLPADTPSPTATPLPPTSTPKPATATSPPPPTATPDPTATPMPDYPFVVLETAQFPTNHLDFDVYIAITNKDNKPLSGYRVLGRHSSGSQVDSQPSAAEWTVNSGAMHYKGGNLKYSMLNSPSGVWTLQLVDEAGNPMAPPVEFPFDSSSPSWYFILYRRMDQ